MEKHYSLSFLFQILGNKYKNGYSIVLSILKSSDETMNSVYNTNIFIIQAMYYSNKIPSYSAFS